MLGVGAPEIFILAVVALVIFGPGKLPEVAGQVGRAVRDFRRMTADLTGEFERTIAEVDDVKESVRREVTGMRAEVEGVSKSVKKDLEGIAETTGTAKRTAPKKGVAGKGGGGRVVTKPKANGLAKGALPTEPMPLATKADPLADVSMLDDEPIVTSTSGPIPVDPPARPAKSNGAVAAAPVPPSAKDGDERGGPAVAIGIESDASPIEDASADGAAGEGIDKTSPAAVIESGSTDAASALAAVGAAEPDDALIRARRRRAEAGYRRRA